MENNLSSFCGYKIKFSVLTGNTINFIRYQDIFKNFCNVR